MKIFISLISLATTKSYLIGSIFIISYILQYYIDKFCSKIIRYCVHFFLLIMLIFSISDDVCETIFDRIIYKIEMPCGLDKNSSKEMINYRAAPKEFLLNYQPSDAVIIIHGMGTTPATFNYLFQYFKNTNKYDVYAPLLKFHGRNLYDLNKANIDEMLDQLNKDIEYVYNKGYKNIYCIGHSLGALLLINLSIKEKLSNQIKLILYMPALVIKAPEIVFQLSGIATPISKYLLFNLYGLDNELKILTEENIATFYPPSLQLIIQVTRFAKYNQHLLQHSSINNKFIYIVGLKDRSLDSKKIIDILDKQKTKCSSFIAHDFTHSPHMYIESKTLLCDLLTNFINILSKEK